MPHILNYNNYPTPFTGTGVSPTILTGATAATTILASIALDNLFPGHSDTIVYCVFSLLTVIHIAITTLTAVYIHRSRTVEDILFHCCQIIFNLLLCLVALTIISQSLAKARE